MTFDDLSWRPAIGAEACAVAVDAVDTAPGTVPFECACGAAAARAAANGVMAAAALARRNHTGNDRFYNARNAAYDIYGFTDIDLFKRNRARTHTDRSIGITQDQEQTGGQH